MERTLSVVVVTYNRLEWLKKNIESLKNQTKEIKKIIIVDNNSNDGTKEYLKEKKSEKNIDVIFLNKNFGGAGGFYYGIKRAIELEGEWISLMDDDCIVNFDCYEKLFKYITDKKNVYAPLRYAYETKEKIKIRKDQILDETKEKIILKEATFNGFTINKELIKKIGFPEKDYFIYGDDDEYSYRVRKNLGDIIMIKDAILYHPYKLEKSLEKNKIKYSSADLSYLRNFYCTRNGILNEKKYKDLGARGITVTLLLKNIIKQILLFRFKGAYLIFKGYIHGKLGYKKSKI